ncbi:MAG: helix-turn-helix domain-containing protein [Pyrinomonadaceae bacterium]|nr:helix-turn-helix domain-containing protein [Pyrinomonadaceae bacterium]
MTKTIQGKKLTSKEAARLLGVSEASVKRWADSGLLPAEKTAGGHRRFRPEDVAIIRRDGLREEDVNPLKKRFPARPLEESVLEPARVAMLVEETFEALMEGHDEQLSELFINLYLQGQTVAAIADHLLCVAMRRVGDLWHEGKLSITQEHVATRTALSTLQNFHAVLDAPKGKQLMALCCSTEEDFHDLPVQLTVLTLEAEGLKVFNLGTSTPFYALREAVERFEPQLVCVSSTILSNLDRAAREYAEFHPMARRTHTSVVLGGAGFSDAGVRKRFPAELYADSYQHLAAFASGLMSPETGGQSNES